MYQMQREWITTCCPELSQSQKEQYLAILDNLEKQKQALSQEEVMAYAAKIRPVLFGSNGEAVLDPKPEDKELYWIESTPIATVSAAFYRKVIGRADGLKEIGRIESYHPFHGYYIFLRPSTADAIYQCPKEILDKVCAFAFVTPDLDVRTTCDFNLEMHKLTIVYFEGEVPQEIAATPVEW